jgi:hypothetical protein
MASIPAFWSQCRPLKVDAEHLDGRALLVFMTKGIVVKTVSEMNATHQAQRQWQSRMAALFEDWTLRADQIHGLAVASNHGYTRSDADQAMVVSLMEAYGADVTLLSEYYNHCRSVQRDISFTSEHDLDYLDLFGDRKRTKQYVQETLDGVEIRYTLACAADCLRLHPGLMDREWNSANASRDSASLWTGAESDVTRFNDMLNSDGMSLMFSLPAHKSGAECQDLWCVIS